MVPPYGGARGWGGMAGRDVSSLCRVRIYVVSAVPDAGPDAGAVVCLAARVRAPASVRLALRTISFCACCCAAASTRPKPPRDGAHTPRRRRHPLNMYTTKPQQHEYMKPHLQYLLTLRARCFCECAISRTALEIW